MQTELKREWLRQLINLCSGLLQEELQLLTSLINKMNHNHIATITEEETNNEVLRSLLQRDMIKYCRDCQIRSSFIILPNYLGIGDLSGLGISLVVKEYEGELVVSKEFQKFKPLLNDSVS